MREVDRTRRSAQRRQEHAQLAVPALVHAPEALAKQREHGSEMREARARRRLRTDALPREVRQLLDVCHHRRRTRRDAVRPTGRATAVRWQRGRGEIGRVEKLTVQVGRPLGDSGVGERRSGEDRHKATRDGDRHVGSRLKHVSHHLGQLSTQEHRRGVQHTLRRVQMRLALLKPLEIVAMLHGELQRIAAIRAAALGRRPCENRIPRLPNLPRIARSQIGAGAALSLVKRPPLGSA